MNEYTITWTGESMWNPPGLLYLAYQNRGVVHLGEKRIGEVIHLANGFYRASCDGIRGEDLATADMSARDLIDIWKEFRA